MNLNLRHLGHTHLWTRPISRRSFLGSVAIAGGAAVTAAAWLPQLAKADFDGGATVFPRPIGIGVAPFGIPIHHFPPVPVLGPAVINEPSQITDFNGMVGICRVTGAGTGTDLSTGTTTRLNFQVDNGFMDGLYVGEDGLTHHGTFGFV
jgi:hypothetical protein